MRGPVVGPALIESAFGGFHDVARRGEIGFADLEVDYIAALRFNAARFEQNIEGRFDLDVLHSFGKFQNKTFRES